MSSKFVFLESMDILSTIPPCHTFIVAFVVLWIVWFFVKRNQSDNNSTNDELIRKLEQWKPEPLVSETQKDHPSLNPRKITSRIGKRITVDGRDCLNLGTHNYLGLTEDPEIEQKAAESIEKYGVGSCGPRGFYGTVDVHLELEENIANFMQMEEAVVYSYGFSTIASAIPAYCNRKDLIFVDEKVNFAIQKGLDATRANIKYFRHNNVKDLENLLETQIGSKEQNSNKTDRTRKFLIIEGIYMNTGTICPLPELVALCRKYKLRIFVDESISFGTLGPTGRGVTEHFNIPQHEIDMIMGTRIIFNYVAYTCNDYPKETNKLFFNISGSLEWAVGSIGGFCVGSSFIIEHQRLAGKGYCFSASLPPLLTSAAIASLDIMKRKPEIFSILKENCLNFDKGVREIKHFECVSSSESPIKHLYFRNQYNPEVEEKLFKKISEECFKNNLIVIVPAYLQVERECPRPSLRICISAALNQNDINFALKILRKCTKETMFF